MEQKQTEHFVYILRCADDTFYTGWTTDVPARVNTHNGEHGAKYTHSRRPVTLVYQEKCADKSSALKRECEIKALSRKKKEFLIENSK